MILTILCENSVARPFGLLGEHGFACFLETPHGNYLFDTGQGQSLIPNAQQLNKDLRSINPSLTPTKNKSAYQVVIRFFSVRVALHRRLNKSGAVISSG